MKKTVNLFVCSLFIFSVAACSSPTATETNELGTEQGTTDNNSQNIPKPSDITPDKAQVTTIIDGSKASNNINFMQNMKDLVVSPNGAIYLMDDKTVYFGTSGVNNIEQLTDKHTGKTFSIPFTEMTLQSFILKDNNIYIANAEKEFIKLTVSGKEIINENKVTVNNLKLNHISGHSFDNAGNMFISDQVKNIIVKIDSSSNTSTLAGSDAAGKSTGFKNGKGDNALFNFPNKMCVDKNNNIYIADTKNHAIRKITPDGTVTTVAGNGKNGYKDGKATEAQFNEPNDVTIDSKGNLFVADTQNNVIRRIDKDGNVSTFAGHVSLSLSFRDGNGNEAIFYNPVSLEIDKDDNLYVLDSRNYKIRKIVTS